MTNIEAARVLAELLKQPTHLSNRERLAVGKAIKELRKMQSRKRGDTK